MIYKDFTAYEDRVGMPAKREDTCLHCGGNWYQHSGWACNKFLTDEGIIVRYHDPRRTFKGCPEDKRYLTKSMADSISATQPVKSAETTTAADGVLTWRSFAHNHAGDCPCGIRRAQCTYHGPGVAHT